VSRPRGLALLAVALLAAPCAASAATTAPRTVVIAFLPQKERKPNGSPVQEPTILERLDARPQLALGLSGAVQSRYDPIQALLDLTQGTRTSRAAYKPNDPPPLALYRIGDRAIFAGWLDEVDRANAAPADIVPGLLASSIPGGAGYAGVSGRSQLEAIVAADKHGHVGLVSIGPAADVAQRAQRLLTRKRLVVVGLPTGQPGEIGLDALLAARRPNELLIVMQTPPKGHAPHLLATGIVGLGRPGLLTSDSTHLKGVIAGIDVPTTALNWLGIPTPSVMKGQLIRIEGHRDAQLLMDLDDRLAVVSARRFPALETVLAAWLGVFLLLAVVWDRRGVRAAMRIGALAMLWILPMLLVTAAFHPGKSLELAIVAVGTFALALLTEALVPWPRGPLIPCAVCVIAYSIDLARGSDLIIRSLLGPNPRFGSRYYGIGNELEASLPPLLFIAIGILLAGQGKSRRGALAFAIGGLVLGAIIGSGRLGADVGGVITIGAGTATAVLFMLPGGITRRRLVLAVATPFAALVGLAGLDLATGGNGHFTRTVLHAHGEGALQDIVVRRYALAFNVLKRGLMPFATAIALLTIAYGLRYRERIFAPLRGDAGWTAALAGGLGSSVAGALANDSGPMLLLFGTFVLVVTAVYIRGDPELAHAPAPSAAGVAGADGAVVPGADISAAPR
jgi:hypothetical protein